MTAPAIKKHRYHILYKRSDGENQRNFGCGFESHRLYSSKKIKTGKENIMNYYEQQLERFHRNFNFSFKIYEGRPLEQKTLCLQMKEKVEHFRIPKNFAMLYRTRQQLVNYIQDTYLEVQTQEKAGKYGS